jgi:E3 ubiquitin-protein ligase DOA10
MIIAIVILLSATSIGSLLMFFWPALVKFTFFCLKKSGAISVVLVPAEKEVIE